MSWSLTINFDHLRDKFGDFRQPKARLTDHCVGVDESIVIPHHCLSGGKTSRRVIVAGHKRAKTPLWSVTNTSSNVAIQTVNRLEISSESSPELMYTPFKVCRIVAKRIAAAASKAPLLSISTQLS
jgi:hypothetical protein